MKRLAELLLALLFLLPILILARHFGEIRLPQWHDIFPFLKSSLIQATLSGALSVALGTALAIGLLSLEERRYQRWLSLYFLIPGFVPGIFIVLSVLHIYGLIDVHPMGYLGVVTANVFMSCGLVAVFLERALRNKVGGFAELAYLEGASPSQTFLRIAPLLRRDFFAMFLTVFIFSFLGFAIPLVLGGLKGATLEVQIYRKVISEGAVGEALALSILQIVFIAICAQLMPTRTRAGRANQVNLKFLGNRLLLNTFVGLNAMILFAPIAQVFSGAASVMNNEVLRSLVLRGGLATLLVGLVAGTSTLAVGLLLVYLWPTRFISRFFFAYSAPSAVLIGFGFYIVGVQRFEFVLQIAMLGAVLALFFWPSLYRLSFHSAAASLQRQFEIAAQMGAGPWQTFRSVAWPQMRGTVYAMAALAALWAAGDFGISSMFTSGDATLSLLIKNLISRYRLPEATFVLWILIFIAALTAGVFVSAYRIGNRKATQGVR